MKQFFSKNLILIMLITVFCNVAVTLYWSLNKMYTITGDEPHYLLITESLIKDKDFFVANNYNQDTLVSKELGTKLTSHQVNGFSVHGVGLSIFLSISYLIQGVIGAKIFLAMFYGISLPFIFYNLAQIIVKKEVWSGIITLFFSCGLPFIAASNQIYPDLLGGVLILFIVWILFSVSENYKITANQIFIIGGG